MKAAIEIQFSIPAQMVSTKIFAADARSSTSHRGRGVCHCCRLSKYVVCFAHSSAQKWLIKSYRWAEIESEALCLEQPALNSPARFFWPQTILISMSLEPLKTKGLNQL